MMGFLKVSSSTLFSCDMTTFQQLTHTDCMLLSSVFWFPLRQPMSLGKGLNHRFTQWDGPLEAPNPAPISQTLWHKCLGGFSLNSSGKEIHSSLRKSILLLSNSPDRKVSGIALIVSILGFWADMEHIKLYFHMTFFKILTTIIIPWSCHFSFRT